MTTAVTKTDNGTARQEVARTTREAQKPVVTDKADTFTLHAPRMATTLDNGKKREIEISISRGREFNESVKLEFKPPAGVVVTPMIASIPSGQDKVTVTVESTKDAVAGKTQIEVMAIPEKGKSVALMVPVEIKHTS